MLLIWSNERGWPPARCCKNHRADWGQSRPGRLPAPEQGLRSAANSQLTHAEVSRKAADKVSARRSNNAAAHAREPSGPS